MNSETTTPSDPSHAIVLRLLRVAAKNDDQFRFNCEIIPKRSGLEYRFRVTEAAEGHEFTGGNGSTIEEAILKAGEDIESACSDWGYEAV